MEGSITCGLCSRVLLPGTTRYVFDLRVFADFDGIIDLNVDKDLNELIAGMEEVTDISVEEQVYLERRRILCAVCRLDILKSLSALISEEDETVSADDDTTDEGCGQLH